ncbi:MAG TPA: hypothetical protein VHF25_09825 [Nitriliruptorales bacterium]|nr:hypothetical protein [Nitriliruptorales bacterium]
MLRRPVLPHDLHDAWWSFAGCAEAVDRGCRRLLATLPAGRVEPAPVAVGLDAMAAAIEDARTSLRRWRHVDRLHAEWERCAVALHESAGAIPATRQVAARTAELEELLGAVQAVVDPLDAFVQAERAWRRRWRLPSRRLAS